VAVSVILTKYRQHGTILTATTNLIQLQRQLKNVSKGDFEFRNTKTGTRVITKSMTNFEAVKSYFSSHNLSYYSFFAKSQKPIKAVLRHLPLNTPAEDISDGLINLGFDVVSVKQGTTRRSPSEGTRYLPLFLITLPRTAKSQEIFKLNNRCRISIKVEAYRAQSGLTQCHNCQQFGHVWANCSQPPRCLWCGGGHLHKEFPENENTTSTPVCCNCQLVEGEKPHPAKYRGCRPLPGHLPVAVPPEARKSSVPAPVQQQKTGQSVQASHASSQPFENMLKVVTVVQQIMTEISGALTQEQIVASPKLF
jgi:hypothetical protein